MPTPPPIPADFPEHWLPDVAAVAASPADQTALDRLAERLVRQLHRDGPDPVTLTMVYAYGEPEGLSVTLSTSAPERAETLPGIHFSVVGALLWLARAGVFVTELTAPGFPTIDQYRRQRIGDGPGPAVAIPAPTTGTIEGAVVAVQLGGGEDPETHDGLAVTLAKLVADADVLLDRAEWTGHDALEVESWRTRADRALLR